MTDKKDEALKLALEAAYLAGWNASGEGYNSEYPFGDHARNPEEDAAWIKDRDNALREALAEQPAQQQEPVAWQPIETAPKKEVKILLRSFSGLIAEGYFLRAAYNGVGGWVWPYIHQNPVHWMPLPPPPPIEAAHGIKENT